MTTPRHLARRVAHPLRGAAPRRAPDWVLSSALTTIDSTRQRRGPFAPWRFPSMTTSAKLSAAAAVVILVGAFALWRFAPTGGSGGPPPSPTPAPTAAPSPTAISTPAPSTFVPPALTRSFTSDVHGLSLTFPEGWAMQPATEPWTTPGPFFFRDPFGDFFWDPRRADHLFLAAASQPLDGIPFDEWSTDFLTGEGCAPSGAVTIDGIVGVLGEACGQALVAAGGRGYVFWIYRSGDDVELEGVDWTAWLEDILATVQLSPADAVDASPTSSPPG